MRILKYKLEDQLAIALREIIINKKLIKENLIYNKPEINLLLIINIKIIKYKVSLKYIKLKDFKFNIYNYYFLIKLINYNNTYQAFFI